MKCINCKYIESLITSCFMNIFHPNRPLTLSENLTKQALKIDWAKDLDEEDENDIPSITGVTDKESEEDSKKTDVQASSWPWDSVRNKLRLALTEVCVLADVISIAKDKRYMVLDPVQQEQPDQRQLAQLYSKKRVKIFINPVNKFLFYFMHLFPRVYLQQQIFYCMVQNV